MAGGEDPRILISFVTLRQLLGGLGMALPVVVILGGTLLTGDVLRGSISAYYYSNMRDLFVGLLWLVGLFLLSYQGYDWRDRATSAVAGAGALGVATFPTAIEGDLPGSPVGMLLLEDHPWSVRLHEGSAVVLFLSLAVMSTFLFTLTEDPAGARGRKQARNRIYRGCGIVMFAALAAVVPFSLPLGLTRPTHLILGVEWVCLWAFGVAWLVKGEAILADVGTPPRGLVAMLRRGPSSSAPHPGP